MSVLILVTVAVLLFWICWTRERYIDPTIRYRGDGGDGRVDDDDGGGKYDAHAQQQAAVFRAEAEFWGRRAGEATTAENRSFAAELAAHYRDRADELEL